MRGRQLDVNLKAHFIPRVDANSNPTMLSEGN
jgi:hypothetical protein